MSASPDKMAEQLEAMCRSLPPMEDRAVTFDPLAHAGEIRESLRELPTGGKNGVFMWDWIRICDPNANPLDYPWLFPDFPASPVLIERRLQTLSLLSAAGDAEAAKLRLQLAEMTTTKGQCNER